MIDRAGPPSMDQQLLLQVTRQLSSFDEKFGILQGQNTEIIREQQRVAEQRTRMYEQINRIDRIASELERITPMVDAHEAKHNRNAGAMTFGKALLALFSGAVGALMTLSIKFMTDKP